jgi:hypothetical protein
MKRIVTLAATAAMLALAPTAANAATIVVNSVGFDAPGHRNGNISYTPSSYTLNNVGIGRLKLSGTDAGTMSAVQFLTYCVDIFHTLGAGTFTMPALSSYVTNPLKLTQLTALVSNADPLIAVASTATAKRNASAAVQLGVWEILYEGSGTYNLGSGDFRVSNGDSAAARTLANTWLGNVTGGTWTPAPGKQLGFLYNARNQSQIFLTGVPEPMTWAMMLLGFGLVGNAIRGNAKGRMTRTVLA